MDYLGSGSKIGSTSAHSSEGRRQTATVISLCVGLSLDTLTAYHLIALAGYTLLPGNRLHRLYAYFIENSEDLTVWECSEFLRSMGYCRKGELLGSQQRI